MWLQCLQQCAFSKHRQRLFSGQLEALQYWRSWQRNSTSTASSSTSAVGSTAVQRYAVPMFQVVDALEDELTAGGCLVDYHSCDFFPERCALCRNRSCLLTVQEPFLPYSVTFESITQGLMRGDI
jgi:hypothetical protein